MIDLKSVLCELPYDFESSARRINGEEPGTVMLKTGLKNKHNPLVIFKILRNDYNVRENYNPGLEWLLERLIDSSKSRGFSFVDKKWVVFVEF